MVIQFIVHGANGEKMTIDVCEHDEEMKKITLLQLKQKVARRLPGKAESVVADMKLIFAGSRMEDDHKALAEFGLTHRSTLQMVMRLDGGLAAPQIHRISSPSPVH